MDTQKKINEYDKKNRDQLKQIKKIDDDLAELNKKNHDQLQQVKKMDDDLAELNKKNHDQSKQVKKTDDDLAGLNDDLSGLNRRLDGPVGAFKPATTFALLEASLSRIGINCGPREDTSRFAVCCGHGCSVSAITGCRTRSGKL